MVKDYKQLGKTLISSTTIILALNGCYEEQTKKYEQPIIKINPTYTTLSGKKEILTVEKLKNINKEEMKKLNLNFRITEGLLKKETNLNIRTINENFLSYIGARGSYQIMPENIVKYSTIKPFNWVDYKDASNDYWKNKDKTKFKRARKKLKNELYKEIVKVSGKDHKITIDELVSIDSSFHPEINAKIAGKYLAEMFYDKDEQTYMDTKKTLSKYYSGKINGIDGQEYYEYINSYVKKTFPKYKISLLLENFVKKKNYGGEQIIFTKLEDKTNTKFKIPIQVQTQQITYIKKKKNVFQKINDVFKKEKKTNKQESNIMKLTKQW